MALFGKSRNQDNDAEENFSDYVDSLLDSQEAASAKGQALRPTYTIDQAIELMRKMPKDNQDLVVAVVRDTLQSANIDVAAIIHDAEQKSSSLNHDVSDLKDKISALREDIKDMEQQIQQAEKDLSETTQVRVLLEASLVKGVKKDTADKVQAQSRETKLVSSNEPTAQSVNQKSALEIELPHEIPNKLAS